METHEVPPRNGSVAAVANAHKRQPIDDHAVTGAGEITVRQSILPVCLVTILFFMWGFAYGLLDVLNAHFQSVLNISKGMSGGLQAAYFNSAMPLRTHQFSLRFKLIICRVVGGRLLLD